MASNSLASLSIMFKTLIPSIVFKHWRQVPVELVVEAIGGEVTEESKVRNICDNHDVIST